MSKTEPTSNFERDTSERLLDHEPNEGREMGTGRAPYGSIQQGAAPNARDIDQLIDQQGLAANVRTLPGGSKGSERAAAMREQVRHRLARSRLPVNLQARLVADIEVPGHYSRMTDLASLNLVQPNSSYWGTHCCTTCFCCAEGVLVQEGSVGLLRTDDEFHFLAPGYHRYSSLGTDFFGQMSLNTTDEAVVNGPAGFVTITDGRIGLLQIFGDFKLLAPGTYQWSSSAVTFIGSMDITKNTTRLGPYKLVTVPMGMVAVTFNNGDLHVLGLDASSRTYFLDDPKWVMEGMLSTQDQTDRLEGNDLLSKDNVELLMVAMSQWKIVDPVAAVTQCGSSMDEIRNKVNSLVRAAIARIVAGTNIGAGPVAGATSNPVVMGRPADSPPTKSTEEADLAHLMQSEQATRHMAELTDNMTRMGIQVIGVFVPEKRMKNDDIRHEVAKQAVIGIKAEAQRSAADASAYATVTEAQAQAQAIETVARAHSEAGRLLGAPDGTAARLALTEKTAGALGNANVTLFSGAPNQMPFMLSADPKTMKGKFAS